MFIGHFAVGFAAKKLAPRTSLGSLFFAAQFLDLLWPIFLLAGLEHVRISPGNTRMSPFDFYDYPITHSLLTAGIWSLLVVAAYYALRRRARAAWVMGLGVFSHWILDFLVHRPDLPLWPGGPRVGFRTLEFVGAGDDAGSGNLRRRRMDVFFSYPGAR